MSHISIAPQADLYEKKLLQGSTGKTPNRVVTEATCQSEINARTMNFHAKRYHCYRRQLAKLKKDYKVFNGAPNNHCYRRQLAKTKYKDYELLK